MRHQGLTICLGLSLLLHALGFAPMLSAILGQAPDSSARPPAPPPLMVQLSAVPPPPEPEPPPPPPDKPISQPQKAPPPPSPTAPATPDAKASPNEEVPAEAQPVTPKKPHKPHHSKPSQPAGGPLTRPDPNGQLPDAGPAPGTGFSVPGPSGTPTPVAGGDATPAPGPEESPTPGPETPSPASSETPAPMPPVGDAGPTTPSGTVPDKPAAPKGSVPSQRTREYLRKVSTKTFIRVLIRSFPDGHIEAEVLTSSGAAELDQAVLQDLREWKWEPAEVAGRPVLSEKPIRLKLES